MIDLAPGLGWLLPFLPSPWMVLVGGPFALAYAAGAATLVAWMRVGRSVGAPYTRKTFHFLIITAAAALHLRWGLGGVTLFGGVVSLVVLYATARGEGHPFYEALARPSDAPHRTLFVLVPLATTALGGVLVNVLFPAFAPVGYMVTAWGDAVGEPVGTRWGRRRYRVRSLAGVPAPRSLEGSAAVLLVSTAAASVVLTAMGFPPGSALAVGAVCGAAAALVEAVSSHGLDNLTVQVVAAAVPYVMLG